MKIALIGYGKMGKEIEKIALQRNHEIALTIDINNPEDLNKEKLKNIDAAIEFTIPEAAISNIYKCFEGNTPVVTGTTAWLDKLAEVTEKCNHEKQALFYASNFSLGVNVFFEINKQLAKIMNQFPDYEIEMEEIHHTQKLDAPSGTGISLAEDILGNLDRKNKWVNKVSDQDEELSIISKRKDPTPGYHAITYDSVVDTIHISHNAKSRQGFALGAVLAAEFLASKQGVFTMKDLIKL